MTLRIGCSTGALFPHYPTEDAVDLLSRLGIEDVEVMLQTHGECGPAFLRDLATRVRHASVNVHSVHALVQMHAVFDAYQRRVAEGWQRFEQVVAGAARMGARALVWHGLCHQERGLTLTSPEVLEAIDRLAGMCAEHDLLLGLENVSWCALSQVRDVLTLASLLPDLRHSEAIAFTFDAFQAVEAGANPFMVLNAMESRLINVHLRDFDEARPARRNLMPGEGSVPWPALIRAIGNAGYTGPLILEGSLGDDPFQTIARVRQLLDPLIEELEQSSTDCNGALPPGVLKGIDLFNTGEFYECHEEIEHEWHAERGHVRLLYQGILQIGVGFHHALGGNQRGAILLLTDGIAKVSQFLPACRGFDTASLAADSQICLDAIRAMPPENLPISPDWPLIPKVKRSTPST